MDVGFTGTQLKVPSNYETSINICVCSLVLFSLKLFITSFFLAFLVPLASTLLPSQPIFTLETNILLLSLLKQVLISMLVEAFVFLKVSVTELFLSITGVKFCMKMTKHMLEQSTKDSDLRSFLVSMICYYNYQGCFS